MERTRADLLDELATGAEGLDDLALGAVLEVMAALRDRRCALGPVEVATLPWRVDPDWPG